MSANLRYLLVLFCVLLTVGADTFPAYNVEARPVTADGTRELAECLFGPDGYLISMHNGRYTASACNGRTRVEYDTISGGVLATDNCKFPDPADGAPKDIPHKDEASRMAKDLLTRCGLLPEEEGAFVIRSGATSNTFLAHEYPVGKGNYVRDEWAIDIAVNLGIYIIVGDQEVAITGGGEKFQVTYGPCGRLIGVQALSRVRTGELMAEIPTKEEAISEFLENMGPLGEGAIVTATLGYQSDPFGICQKVMHPIWVLEADVYSNGEKVPVRPQNSRFTYTQNQITNTQRDLGPAPVPRDVHSLAARSLYNEDDSCKFQVGIEYLGEPYGLSLASQNVAGLKAGVMHTAPIGNVTYEKNNTFVWESDWTTDDDTYADSVDMLFYTGHANGNGWMVTTPGTGATGTAHYTSFNGSDDLLGHQDLEWLIIAACGPHQDEAFEKGAGSVFDRWRGIFQGLHIMFGYGTPSSDSAEEGAKFMRYAQEGNSLIDAWFRAAKEVQPPGVIVTAMWADNARYDYLPGYGSVSNDSCSPPRDLWFMWTTT